MPKLRKEATNNEQVVRRSRGRPRKKCNKQCLTMEKDKCNAVDLLQKKYEHILGFKEPIILLQKCSISPVMNKNYIDLHFKAHKISKKSNTTSLTKDATDMKKLNKEALSLHNTNLELTNLPESEIVQCMDRKTNDDAMELNKHIDLPKYRYKLQESKNSDSLLKKNEYVSVPNDIDSRSLGDKKQNMAIKAKVLRSNRKSKVNVRQVVNYDNNSNIISENSETESKPSDDLEVTQSTDSTLSDYKSASSDFHFKRHNMCRNNEAYNRKTRNSKHTNYKKKIDSTNSMVSNGTTRVQISNGINNRREKEDTFLTENTKEDLALRDQEKDYEKYFGMISYENLQGTRQLPIITEKTTIAKNAISMEEKISKAVKNESTVFCSKNVVQEDTDCKDLGFLHKNLPEISIYKCPSTNVRSRIKKTDTSNVINNNLLEKRNKRNAKSRVTEIKDSTKNIGEDNLLSNQSNKLSNVKCNRRLRLNTKDKNANIVLSPQSALPEDVITSTDTNVNKCLNERDKISALNTNTLINDHFSQAEQKCTIVSEQTIINKETETVKISNAAQSVNESIRKRVNDNQNIITENTKKVKLNRNHWLQSVNCKNKQAGPDNKLSATEPNVDRTVPEIRNIYDVTNCKLDIVIHNESNKNANAQILQTENEKVTSDLVKQKQTELLNGSINKKKCDPLQNTWKQLKTATLRTLKTNTLQATTTLETLKTLEATTTLETLQTKTLEPTTLQTLKEKTFEPTISETLKEKTFEQKISETLKAIPETQELPAKNNCLMSDTVDNTESITDDENEDFDCMSLAPNAELMKEFDDLITTGPQNSRYLVDTSEKSYEMTDHVFKNYYRSTASEFNKVYDTSNVNDQRNNTVVGIRKSLASRLGKPVNKESNSLPITEKSVCFPLQNHTPTEPMGIGPLLQKNFRGFCYQKIKTGKCQRHTCPYKHDPLVCMLWFYKNGEQYLFGIIDELVARKYLDFVRKFYEALLSFNAEQICVLKVLKKLYELNIVTDRTILKTIESFEVKGISTEVLLNYITSIVSHNDAKFVNCILKLMQDRISHYVNEGEYWSTLKPLLVKVEHVDSGIIENILRECLFKRKNVQDVYENILNKVHNLDSINQKLLSSMKSLLKHTLNESQVLKETASPQSIRSIDSPSLDNEVNQTDAPLPIVKTSRTVITKQWMDTSNKTKKTDNNNNNAQDQNQLFTLHPIDNLPKPYSAIGRNKFWKFYLDVHSLQEGLMHNDHDHVIKIFSSAKQEQKTIFSRACLQILRNELKSSPCHLKELAWLAVRTGITDIAYEILLDVMRRILAHLAEKELWVLAFQLLKDIDMVMKLRKRFFQFDAGTILLFIEVYLANQQAIEALALLQKTNIIYTDRSKWKVQNNERDDYVRAGIIALLLDTFCKLSSEHAFFLFHFLIADQNSNFYPVDLVRSANKLVTIILLEHDEEMILDTANLINNYDITPEPITYRALIAVLVNINAELAKQFYQKAIALGIYSDVKFYPVTHIIVNFDWTREEMYLAILNIMQQLSLNIGHATDHVSARQLSVYVHFENIPSEKQLACSEGKNQQCIEKLKKAKLLMANILQKEFNPPISMQNTKKTTVCQLTGKSVQQYLLYKYLK